MSATAPIELVLKGMAVSLDVPLNWRFGSGYNACPGAWKVAARSGLGAGHRKAAVDIERGTADEGGAVRGQINDRFGDLGRVRGAPGGELGVQLRPAVLVAEQPFRLRSHVRFVAARNRRSRI